MVGDVRCNAELYSHLAISGACILSREIQRSIVCCELQDNDFMVRHGIKPPLTNSLYGDMVTEGYIL